MAGCAVNYTQEQSCEKEDLGYFDGVGGRIAAKESLFAEIGGLGLWKATKRTHLDRKTLAHTSI